MRWRKSKGLLNRSTTSGHLARATVESMAYQSRDVMAAMQADSDVRLRQLRVDGGAVVNDDLMQFQADILGKPVQRPSVSQTTALGAAYLAGLAVGFWKSMAEISRNWALEREFRPQLSARQRKACLAQWEKAVERSKNWLV